MKKSLLAGALALCLMLSVGCSTYDKKEFARENPQVAARQTRWTVNETPYEEAPLYEKVGRNFRDGLWGFVDSYFLGFYSVQVIASPRSGTGFFSQKLAVFVGDVIGLVDDNPWTEHVFKGIVSRQLYRYGSRAGNMPKAIAKIHEQDFDVPEKSVFDYIGDRPFHYDVYFEPGAIPSLIGIVLGDFIVRPTGHLLLMFSLHDTGKKVDESGYWLMEKGLNIPFL